jgi:hypothetical protein
MNSLISLRALVKPGFGTYHKHTLSTAKAMLSLFLGSRFCNKIPNHADHTTIMISLIFVLIKRSFAPHCIQPNRFIRLILSRFFKILPSNVGFHETPIEELSIPPMFYRHVQPHKGVPEFSFAVDVMLARFLRGEIMLSFSQIMHVLSFIQRHMREAYEKYAIMALILRDEERRSWQEFDLDCSCPENVSEIDCIIAAEEILEEFQQRFLYFIDRCCFYFWMQRKRTFSRLQ